MTTKTTRRRGDAVIRVASRLAHSLTYFEPSILAFLYLSYIYIIYARALLLLLLLSSLQMYTDTPNLFCMQENRRAISRTLYLYLYTEQFNPAGGESKREREKRQPGAIANRVRRVGLIFFHSLRFILAYSRDFNFFFFFLLIFRFSNEHTYTLARNRANRICFDNIHPSEE